MSQAKYWLQRHWRSLLSITVVPFILMLIAVFFGIATVLAKEEIMKALIQAETTVLGFFGIMVVYFLKSLDDKESTYAEKLLELEVKGKHEDIVATNASKPKTDNSGDTIIMITFEHRGEFLKNLMLQAHEQKRATIRFTRPIVAYLISSILLSIWILGMPDAAIAGMLSIFAVYLFVVSIVSIFWLLGDIGKTRFETLSKK